MSNRTICKYYQQGRCNKGNSCKYLHVKENNGFNNYGNNNNNNNNNNNSNKSAFWAPENLDKRRKEVQTDLEEVRQFDAKPVLSSYGLAPPSVLNLIHNRDMSFEELRYLYYTNPQEYEKSVNARIKDYDKVLSFLKNQDMKAARYLQLTAQEAAKHNGVLPKVKPFVDFEIDFNSGSSNSPFGTVGNNNNGGTLFGSSGFGSKSQSLTGAFGNLGGSTNSGFGSTAPAPSSAFGSTAFGASSGNAFSKPVGAFGSLSNNNNNTSSGFGSAGFGTGSSAFGSSGFGSTNNNSNNNNNNSSSSAFGSSGFGTSAFGSSATTGSSPFGAFGAAQQRQQQPFAAAQPPSTTSPFGMTLSKTAPNPFANNTTSTTSPFAAANTNSSTFFGATSNVGSSFGNVTPASTATTATTAINPFATQTTASSTPFGFGVTPTNITTNSNTLGFNQAPGLVQAGVPAEQTSIKDLSEKVINLFKNDRFELGKVPEIPPPLELC
ncbi:hypothetical protein PACTADRAFT_47768 [Pachysolen tannophilus NRRL Y-2460]|uniref:C3H1-type domain-containing protein n=1 Tax=Pachysolen tannophilus NRRL Y-2460 TaxID=669874 RepID=A0A1E4U214_PACTA|nr:hypothetical protein PACTADRAFT_47768 [Pachysolen tannophilus NRRL Y-2460]